MKRLLEPSVDVWAVTFLVAGLMSNFFFMCGANLVATAVVAGATLGRRAAIVVSLGIWAETQTLGFTLFHYPHDATTLGWGAALGIATLAATLVASPLSRAKPLAFGAAFFAYEVTLAAFGLSIGDGLTAFAPRIVAIIFAVNAANALAAVVLYYLTGYAQARLTTLRRT